MKVKWTGIGNRFIGLYVWSKENDYTQDVPLELAAELATYPGNQFQLVNPADEPDVVSFVEGDARPVDELKASNRRKPKEHKLAQRSDK